MKRERVLTVVFIALTLGFFACQKDSFESSTNGPSALGVKIQALNKSFYLPVGGTKSASEETSSITWDSAHMVVSSVKLEAELKSLVSRQDSIEISYKWSGPQVTDLMDSTITFGDFILQPGFYDEIEIVVKGSEHDAGNIPVFYLSGIYTKGSSTTVPVKVEVFEDVTFKTEKDSVEVTAESIDITSHIQLYLDELMAGIDPYDLDNARMTEGIIVISKESNRNIYRTIMHNLVKDHHSKYRYKHKDKYHHHDDDDHDDD